MPLKSVTAWKSQIIGSTESTLLAYNFQMFKFATLRNWALGRTVRVRSDSEVVQWLLDARWFNWSRQHRNDITRDVEACAFVWITPTRLGAILDFPCQHRGMKIWGHCFIQLFDDRIMTLSCFRLRTYKQFFARFFKEFKWTSRLGSPMNFHA